MRIRCALIFLLAFPAFLSAQKIFTKIDTSKRPAQLMEFMFRTEYDNAYKDLNGIQVADRSRLRARMRYGLAYQIDYNVRMGFQVRTGYRNNPQDPQITFGEEPVPGSGFPLMIERLYARISNESTQLVLGKNYYPFKKYHEMYWSDWVNPNGIYFRQNILDVMELRTLFSVMQSNGSGFGTDGYLFGVQLPFTYVDSESKMIIEHNQTFHYFNNIPILPSGLSPNTYSPFFYYPSVKLIQPTRRGKFYALAEVFLQFKQLSKMDTTLLGFDDQTTGGMGMMGYEHDGYRSHWETSLNYTYMPRFGAVDYLTQNDWARWNYRDQGSPQASLTNIQGIEFMFRYFFADNINLTMKYFSTSRIINYGSNRESNDRIRLDLNISL